RTIRRVQRALVVARNAILIHERTGLGGIRGWRTGRGASRRRRRLLRGGGETEQRSRDSDLPGHAPLFFHFSLVTAGASGLFFGSLSLAFLSAEAGAGGG